MPCQRNLITHEHVYQKYRQSAFHLRTIQVSVLHFTLHSPRRLPSSISAQSSIEIIHRNIRREKACYFTCKYLLPTSAAARKTASAAEVLRFPHFFMVPSSFFQLPEFHCICICCGWVAANSMCSLVIFFFILTVKSRGGSVSETYFCLFAWQRLTHSIHCLLDSIFSAVLVSFQASMTAWANILLILHFFFVFCAKIHLVPHELRQNDKNLNIYPLHWCCWHCCCCYNSEWS